MAIAIVGAGIAGLACAEALRAAGQTVTLFDKGGAPGGRMSTRRITTTAGEASFDHGAQYFTVRHPAFRARVEQWRAQGLAAPWREAGADAWVGVPESRSTVEEMAASFLVHWSTQIKELERDGRGWRIAGQAFDIALIATPAEQAAPLLQPWHDDFAAIASSTVSAPCWTVMAALTERLPIGTDILRQAGSINWAARNSAKPGRCGPESWVVQASPEWSRAHLELRPDQVIAPLLGALAERAGEPLPAKLATAAHRWRYAKSGSAGRGHLWNREIALGACGDWLIAPRVEAAWLSGTALAAALLS